MSSTDAPIFSVVMATWGREEHILPSVASVLGQELAHLELLVVGDHCTDGTAGVVAGIGDPRVRWINLSERWGGQSGPNNAGTAAARGRHIAFVGHDDIWEPFHLSDLATLLDAPGGPDFAVAGAVLHGPPDMPRFRVTGLFGDGDAAATAFFPPSSVAHRREVPVRIGPWMRPEATALPVDSEYQLRAVAAGMRFASTGRVSVHKFSASQRHLCYLLPDSHEQAAMLDDLARPGHAARVAAMVESARAKGDFMSVRHPDVSRLGPGDLFRRSQARRGTGVPDLAPIGAKAVVVQTALNLGPQWQKTPVRGFRFSLRTARPRLPLAVTADGPVRLEIAVAHDRAEALEDLALACNGVPVALQPLTGVRPIGGFWHRHFAGQTKLRADRASVLELHLTPEQAGMDGGRGLAVGKMRLVPLLR